MPEKVLVTGGFGLVGSQTVRRLVEGGHAVVATDLGTPAQRKAAASTSARPRRCYALHSRVHDRHASSWPPVTPFTEPAIRIVIPTGCALTRRCSPQICTVPTRSRPKTSFVLQISTG